ncbi:hypothetical protein YPPY94_1538, partial [Yersinia pestis PY-94]
MVSIRSRVSG